MQSWQQLFVCCVALSPRQLGDKGVELGLVLAQLVPTNLDVLELPQVASCIAGEALWRSRMWEREGRGEEGG